VKFEITIILTAMRVKKVLEVQLDLKNPIDIYANIEGSLLSKLIADYENKCFRSCLVSKVIRIIKRSDCVIAQEGACVTGRINVMFEVEAVVYARDEILTGCVVKVKDKSGVIIASSPLATVFMNAHSTTASITVGQIITVRVGAPEYRHGESTITVNALPYLPTYAFHVYRVGELTPADKLLIQEQLREYNEELAASTAAKVAKPEGWKFFEKITYPYKAEQDTPAGATAVDIATAFETPGYFSHDPRIGLKPMLYRYAKPTDAGAPYQQQLTSAMSAIALISHCTAALRAVREMNSVYTEQSLNAHKNLWLSYMKAK